MALRGGTARRVPGNPMAGILRDIDRRARTTTRRARPARPQDGQNRAPSEPAEPPPAPKVPASGVVAAAVIVTLEDGRARCEFPRPATGVPVVTASPICPVPGDGAMLAVLEKVTTTYAQVRVWRSPSVSGAATDPAGAGVRVHVIATESTG